MAANVLIETSLIIPPGDEIKAHSGRRDRRLLTNLLMDAPAAAR